MTEISLVAAAINTNNIELLKSLYPSVISFSKLNDILNYNSEIYFLPSYELIDYLISIDDDVFLSRAIFSRLIITCDIENLNKLRYLLNHINMYANYTLDKFLSVYRYHYSLYNKAVLRLLIDYKNIINVTSSVNVIGASESSLFYTANDAILYIMFNLSDRLDELPQHIIESLIITALMNNAPDVLLDILLKYLNNLDDNAKLNLQINRNKITFRTINPWIILVCLMFDI